MQAFKEGYVVWGLVARNHLKEMMRLGPSWCMQIAQEEELNKIIIETDAEMVYKMHY
jgi:hypothetical protein